MAKVRKRSWITKTGKHTCWEITYVVDGKQFRKSGYASELDAQVDLPNVIKDTSANVKLSVIIEDYKKRHCALLCKPSTQDLYSNYVKVHLEKFKQRIAKEIKKRDIENLIIELKSKGITNKTINGIMTFVQAVFNYGVEAGYLATNPVGKIKKLPQVKPPIKTLNETQIHTFLKVAEGTRFYAFFATAILTGLRRGELLALEWSDIDFKNKRIKVNKQYYKGMKTTTKTNRERVVDIPDNLIEILKNHKIENNVFSKLVFHNYTGGVIHPYYMEEKHFKPLLEECNKQLDAENQIEHFRFHDLRHTYATYLLSHQVPIKYVQLQLGHASAKMTLDVYASFMPSVKYGALDLLKNIQKNDAIEQELSIKN